VIDVSRLAESILRYAEALPEGRAIAAREQLHLGSRAAVDQALSRLARRGELLRVSRGFYVRPVETRFGRRAPSELRVVESLAQITGETIAPHGAAAANKLGLTTQVPVRSVYLTSGRSRRLKLGAQLLDLRHAPRWQLILGNQRSGEVLRALAWLGPEKAGAALNKLKHTLSASECDDLAVARTVMPSWLAKQISDAVVNA
jgi:hypothetical protein